ncbi:hypothetical protein CRG98_001098, partial [Punica granatum]
MGCTCEEREMGRGPLAEGRSGSGKRRRRRCGRRFSPLDVAARTGMDAGDGSGLRRGRSGPHRRLNSWNRGSFRGFPAN